MVEIICPECKCATPADLEQLYESMTEFECFHCGQKWQIQVLFMVPPAKPVHKQLKHIVNETKKMAKTLFSHEEEQPETKVDAAFVSGYRRGFEHCAEFIEKRFWWADTD